MSASSVCVFSTVLGKRLAPLEMVKEVERLFLRREEVMVRLNISLD